MSKNTLHRLLNRHGRFYFRAVIPLRWQHVVGIREVKLSLQTSDARVARLRCRSLSNAFDIFVQEENLAQFPLEKLREAAKSYFERRLNEALELTLDLPDGANADDLQIEINGFEKQLEQLEQSLKTGTYPSRVLEASEVLLRGVEPDLPPIRYSGAGFDAVKIARKLIAEAECLRSRFLIMELSGGTYDAAPNHPIFRGMLPTHMPDPDRREKERPLQVTDAILKYKALKKSEWGQKTQADQARCLALACEVFGPTKRLAEVSKDDVQKLRDLLMRMPKNALKSKNNAEKALLDTPGEEDKQATLSFKTRDKYFTMIRSFLKWAVDEEYIDC